MSDVQIRVCGLVKRYGRVEVLHELNLETRGDWGCLGVLGRNGAGKTTLLRILVGLLPFEGGTLEVQLEGRTLSHADPAAAVFIAEQQTLVESLTGWQHLRTVEGMNAVAGVGVDAALRVKLIEEFGLEEFLGKPIAKMSKGTRRKLELVAALCCNVPIVVADELAEGVDVPSMYTFVKVIKEAVKNGKRFVVSSHNVGFLSDACDVLAVIDRGRCVDMFQVSGAAPDIKQRVLAAFQCIPNGDEAVAP